MLKLGVAFLLSALLLLPAGPDVDRGTDTGKLVLTDRRPGDDEAEEADSVGRRPARYYYRVVLWSQDLGGFCIAWRSTTDKAYADRQNELGFAIRFDRTTGELRPDCPRAAPAGTTAAPTPLQIAAQVWRQVEDLPVPTLSIEPDHAITGKKVYLQIAGRTTWTRTVDNPIGDDVVITATSEYVVDWNDPTDPTKTVTRSQGGPWPDGDVTHTYTDVSPSTAITVTQRWIATWRAGARSGTLDRLTTEAAPLVLEVRELQAVRRR